MTARKKRGGSRVPLTPLSKPNAKALKTSSCAYPMPEILKKRRVMRKRISLNKLIELIKLWQRDCATLRLTWINEKRERSNPAIRPRQNFSYPFADHILNESDEQFPDRYMNVYKRKGKRKNLDSSEEFSRPKMDSDVIHDHIDNADDFTDSAVEFSGLKMDSDVIHDQIDNAAEFSRQQMDSEVPNQDQNDNTAEFSRQKIDFEVPNQIDQDQNDNDAVDNNYDVPSSLLAVGFNENVVSWAPLTPENLSKVEPRDKDSTNNCDYFMFNGVKLGSNWGGKTESLLETLKNKHTEEEEEEKISKRGKMKRHWPKVFDERKQIKIPTLSSRTPSRAKKVKKMTQDSCKRKLDFNEEIRVSTPTPRTPKRAKKVKILKKKASRNLDFNEECCTSVQEELKSELKSQDEIKSSLDTTKICKKKRRKRQRISPEKLANLIGMIRGDSTIRDKRSKTAYVSIQQEDLCTRGIDLNECVQQKDLCTRDTEMSVQQDFSTSGIHLNVCIQQEDLCTRDTETKHSSEFKTKNVMLLQDDVLKEAMVDYAVQKMTCLCIDDASRQIVVRDSNTSRAIVSSKKKADPFKNAIVSSKKKVNLYKNQKTMVDLDPETERVWDLLNLLIEPGFAKAEDMDDGEYIKGQQKLFDEKIDFFLTCMRVIQGDRQFSLWKGSIVDSIVGVFLTQNVSDNLSSSAYMALASTYPPLSVSEQNSHFARDDQQLLQVETPSTYRVGADVENGNFARDDQQLLQVEPPSSNRVGADVENGNECNRVGANVENGNESNRVEPDVENGNESNMVEPDVENGNENSSQAPATPIIKKKKGKEKQEEEPINWDDLRKQYSNSIPVQRTDYNADSINWEAIRQSSAKDVANVIIDRGMNNQLAGKIKGFLDRLIKDHGSIDLEWLRNVPPLKAKDYLLSIFGLGLKSTECVRLLALHFPAFPIDTNAARVFVRLGWVPLKPLPDGVQFHLLNNYPSMESIQKFVWPRICHLSPSIHYEIHCHIITFAKAFCTKTQPNCNHCPMRGDCKHYASALASSRSRLEGSQAKSCSASSKMSSQEAPMLTTFDASYSSAMSSQEAHTSYSYEPIIEFPSSPGPLGGDIEDIGCDSEIPAITVNDKELSEKIPRIEEIVCDSEFPINGAEFSEKLQSIIHVDNEISESILTKSPPVFSIPMPKLKMTIRLRTVHQVYELPDSHHLLAEFDKREPDEPNPYLFVTWTADETANSDVCSSQESTTSDACSSMVPFEKHDSIQGTILIPCRTANRGRFPLNGTYFQINEVFADHASSVQPISVPSSSLWNLRRRTLYCGTSITSICKGMSCLEVAYCFNRSFICIRAFDTETRAAKSLKRRFHICKTRQADK